MAGVKAEEFIEGQRALGYRVSEPYEVAEGVDLLPDGVGRIVQLDQPVTCFDSRCPACGEDLTIDEGGYITCDGGCKQGWVVGAQQRRLKELKAAGQPREWEGRMTDLATLLTQPAKPIPWRVHNVAADGKLTALTGAGDVGKSWLMLACSLRVHDGGRVAGLPCAQGRALYVDAEMGDEEVVGRLRGLGAEGHEFDHFDGTGLDLGRPEVIEHFEREITGRYQLAVFDSLRALAPSMRENESDSVAPVLTGLRNLARRTGAAVVVLHHKGESDKFYRGSTAIRDQTDAMLTLWEDEQGLRLRCKPGGRMRFAPSPPDLWLTLDPLGDGVQAGRDPSLDPPAPSVRDLYRAQIIRHLPSKTKSAVAEGMGTNRAASAFLGAWESLENDEIIDQVAGVWTVVVAGDPPIGPQQHNNSLNGNGVHPQTTFTETP